VFTLEKKLYRSQDNKMICGVCAGIAEYFHIDPTVIRLAFAILACFGGSGILAYFVAAIIIPPKPI
jgi:phage shock protein C